MCYYQCMYDEPIDLDLVAEEFAAREDRGEPKPGERWRMPGGGVCVVERVGALSRLDNGDATEWCVSYWSEHGSGRLSVGDFVRMFERVSQ